MTLVLLLIVIAACEGNGTKKQTETPQATEEITPTAPVTATPQLTVGPSPTTAPTQTAEPTATPSPTATAQPSLSPTPSPTPPEVTTRHWGTVGDVNYDGVIDDIDLDLISNAIGTDNRDDNWNPGLDIDRNSKIDIADLAIAGRGYGSDHVFHHVGQIANAEKSVRCLDACIDAQDRIHVVWSDSTNRDVYYSRLDRYGNTLIDDVLIDSGASTGVGFVAIGCDDAGNSHMIWDCTSDICQARFDRWGYPVLEKMVVDDRWSGVGDEAAIDVDEAGNAHVFYRMGGNTRIIYAVLTDEGEKPISIEGPLLHDAEISRYRQLAVDDEGNAHLVWSEEDGEDRLYYTRIGADASASIAPMVIGYTHWDGHVNDSHRPSLAVDSAGNALVLWNRSDPYDLLLDKIDSDGAVVINDSLVFPEYRSSYYQDLALDQYDRLHLWAPTGWGSGLYFHAYGVFDQMLEVIEPMHWATYRWRTYDPQLLIDSNDDVHLFYKMAGLTGDNPPCQSSYLCYYSTAFDPVACDRTRPDLGVDVAHLNWSPILARWGQTLTIEAEVFNTGWTDSPETTALFEIVLEDGALSSPLSVDVDIPALAPRQRQSVQVDLSLPQLPPAGYEDVQYVNLQVAVDPAKAIAETTEANNSISVPMMIEPLPTEAGLFMIVRDITPTIRGGAEMPLNFGLAQVSGSGIDRNVNVTDYITILADDLAIESEPVAYTVNWQADGYRTPEAAEVTIGRNADDPYVVDYEPGNTVELETDTWGSLAGTITSDEGDLIVGATVRIKGQGLNINTTTDGDGHFSSENEPGLGQMIPGEYDIFVSAADYARISGNVNVVSLSESIWNRTMEPTTKAYVCGMVYNQYGRPVANADVSACGLSQTTASDGSFDLGEVEASCTQLQVSKSGYADWSESISLSAGLEAYFDPINLIFDPPVSVVQDEGSIASWEQDESSADLLPDPPDDANWFQKKAFDIFGDKFWPSFRVQVWWATYEYYLDGAYTGPKSDRHLYEVQLRLIPKTFEAHRVSGKGSVKVFGRTVKLTISAFEDSGQTTALRVIEARLVDADSGNVIKTVRNPVEGGSFWDALEDTTRTYDFEGVEVDDWDNAEVWLYIKAGKNENDEWTSSPILRGWHYDQQVLRFDLDHPEDSHSDYILVDFPIP